MFKDFGVFLILVGLFILVVGLFLVVLGHTGFKMPLDIIIRGKNFVVYIPLGTSILLSVLLTLILSIVFRSK